MNNKIVRDSYGNILSQEQIEYFKNSKVRDNKDNLLVVFHGTPKAIFNEFNPKETEGFKFDENNVNYFTTNKNVAYSYSGTHDIIDRKSISPKGEAGIYALYINIEHPLIIDAKGNYWNKFEINDSNKVKKDFLDKCENKRDKKISKEFINDLKKVNFEIKEDKYSDLGLFSGNYEIACCVEEVGEVIDEIIDDLKSDATIFKTTNDIVKEAIDSGNYDGVIFKNMIDSGGYGSDQSSDVYVTIESPNQIKSITNKKPSSAHSILENKNSRLSNIEALFELDLLEENILTEAKEDIQKFVDKFGQDTYDLFIKSKDRLKNNKISTDIIYHVKNTDVEDMKNILHNLQSKVKVNSSDDLTKIQGKYNYIGQKDGYKIFQPLDALASMNLGVGSGWCTTGRYNHYGDVNFKPSIKDAETHWNNYTSRDVKFYYLLDAKTMLAKYAVAIYPQTLFVDKIIGDFYVEETNFEIFNAEDKLDYNLYFKLKDTLEIIPDKLEVKVEDKNNIILKSNKYKNSKEIVIPEGVKIIDSFAFRDCKKLESIKLPTTLEKINQYAFLECTSLESINIPHNLKEIRGYAFAGCTSLKSIELPDSVTKLGPWVFSGCENLQNIKLSKNITDIEDNVFYHCYSLKDIVIPDSVTNIGYSAFRGCTSLENIIIPSNVKIIEALAFIGCPNLTIYCETELIERPEGWSYRWNPDNRPVIWGYNKNNKLTEDVHNTLNPLLFNSDMELKDEVKEKLNEIVTEFKNKLEEYNIKLNIKDVCLVGSNVNYNYNKNSDLDLHIVADSKDDCNENHLAVIYELYKKIFNDKYDIKIKDIPVELYIEMDEINANSNGIYSLNNGWIKKPKKEIVKEVNIDKEYNFWLNKYNKTIEKKNIEAIDNFIDSIYNLRQESIKKDGEFGKGNLVFKRFRNEGLLDKIKRLKVDLESKKLTLEDFDYGTEDIQGKNVFDKNITGMTYYDQLLPSNPDYEYYSNKRNVESKIKYMTPERYYEYCAKDIFNTSVDNLKNQRSFELDYIEKLKTVITEKKKKFPITILDFNEKQQEGLHRMFVVGELFGWRNERFPVLCVYPKTEDLILKESKKRKSKKNKGFGWFSSLNPNAGNVEQNVAFFNNAMGSNISGSMGEDLEDESDTIKEISDVLDNWAKFGFNNELRPFKDDNIDDDLSGTFHQAFVELKYDKEENCFGFTFDFGTADKDKAIIDLSERLKKFNLIPEIKEDKILLKYNKQINEDINNQFELGSAIDFILTELKKQNIPFNFNYKDLFVFKNIDDMKNAEEIIKQKSDYILLPDLFATPAIQLGKINLYEHYDILGGNKVLENSLNDVIENFNKDIIYPKLVENKNIKCYTSAFFNTLVLTSWDTNEKFYLCFGYLQPENDNSDIIDNIISHSWIELSDGRIIETNKRSDLKRIPDNKLKFEFISDGDIDKAVNKIKETIEKLK